MANWFSSLFGFNNSSRGFSWLYGSSPRFNTLGDDTAKLAIVFSNPAVCKVFALNCDLFSLGKVTVNKQYFNGKETPINRDALLALMESPNPLQSGTQFKWDIMFHLMQGNAYIYCDSDVVSSSNRLYVLNPTQIIFPREISDVCDKLVFSEKKIKELGDVIIQYRYNDGTVFSFPFKKLSIVTDMSNGTGNYFKGNSRLDALYKIISNSELALDANNISLEFIQKFIVSGKTDPQNPNETPMGPMEKKSLVDMIKSKVEKVFANKNMIEIKRFVDDMAALKLDEIYSSQYFLIGSMFNIPRDVLEASLEGSTYENQEKSRASHCSYCLQPKGNDVMNVLAKRFGYLDQNKVIEMSWDHLPFNQVFKLDEAKNKESLINSYIKLLDQGVDQKEAVSYLDLPFTSGAKQERKGISINAANQ